MATANIKTDRLGCLVNLRKTWSCNSSSLHFVKSFLFSRKSLKLLRMFHVIPLAFPCLKSGDKTDILNTISSRFTLSHESKHVNELESTTRLHFKFVTEECEQKTSNFMTLQCGFLQNFSQLGNNNVLLNIEIKAEDMSFC